MSLSWILWGIKHSVRSQSAVAYGSGDLAGGRPCHLELTVQPNIVRWHNLQVILEGAALHLQYPLYACTGMEGISAGCEELMSQGSGWLPGTPAHHLRG